MSTVLVLDKYKNLFKDEQAFRQFADILEGATADNVMRLVLCGEEVVGAFISPGDAQERLRERIMKRLAKNPAVLDTLKSRLESDEIVQ